MSENDRSGILTAQQRRAVQLLTTELTMGAVAKQVGCGEATLRRWRKKPVFRAALRVELDRQFEDGTRLLTAAQKNLLTELLTLALKADDPNLRARVGLGLESALSRRRELLMISDLHQRLDMLEAETDDDDATETSRRDAAS